MIDNYNKLLDNNRDLRQPPPASDEKKGQKDFSIYCANIPSDYNEEELKQLFGQYGVVNAIDAYKPGGSFHGVVFVRMDNAESCQMAVDALNGRNYRGNQMNISIAHDRNQRDKNKNKDNNRRDNNNRNNRDNNSRNHNHPAPPYPFPPYPYPYPYPYLPPPYDYRAYYPYGVPPPPPPPGSGSGNQGSSSSSSSRYDGYSYPQSGQSHRYY